MEFSGKILAEISHNLQVKTYPNGAKKFLLASGKLFRETGWELADKWDAEPRENKGTTSPQESLARARRRARSKLYDLAYSNDFRWFVTLTLDQSRIDRYDMSAITKKLNVWLDNRVRRDGLRYVLVPERHKDGAVHFHGLMSDSLTAVSSGTWALGGAKPRRPRSAAEAARWASEGWHEVFNLPAWKLGFTTAIALYGDRRAAVGYVCKYIGKQDEKIGGRWYYSGGNLLKPSIELFDADWDDYAGRDDVRRFRLDELGVDMLSWEVEGENHG